MNLTFQAKSRVLRIAIAPWVFLGHGVVKLAHWFFDISLWGPHIEYVPKNFFSGLTAILEFLCPLLILIGFKVRYSSMAMMMIFLLSTFFFPFPWLHIRVPVEGQALPFAIIVSKEINIIYACAYLSIFFYGQDEKVWDRN